MSYDQKLINKRKSRTQGVCDMANRSTVQLWTAWIFCWAERKAIKILMVTNEKLFIINLLLIWGINFAAYNVFKSITGWYEVLIIKRNLSAIAWTCKPLYACKPCMSSLWGICGFYFTSYDWYWYPLWVVCLAGASAMIKRWSKYGTYK